jgi:cbb3-type cytochrome oxidase subunit 3
MSQDDQSYIWAIMGVFIVLVLGSIVFFCYRLHKREKLDAEKGDTEKQAGDKTKDKDDDGGAYMMMTTVAACDY